MGPGLKQHRRHGNCGILRSKDASKIVVAGGYTSPSNQYHLDSAILDIPKNFSVEALKKANWTTRSALPFGLIDFAIIENPTTGSSFLIKCF